VEAGEPDRIERRIDIANNFPNLLKFEIDPQACHRRTIFPL
jgi:hypothetical protein